MDTRFAENLTGADALLRVAEIARELAEAEDLDDTLQRIVDLAEGYLEHCDGATMMLVRGGGQVVTPASSNLDALAADEAQHSTGEGPCLTALYEHEIIFIEDFADEERWPGWRDKVRDLGWRSMVGLRLFVAEDTLGALDLYSRRTHGFDEHSRVLASIFVSHASVAMKAAITERGLQRALESRDVIGQAKGVLMERERLSGRQAFERLRELSNQHNIKLRDLAQGIAETGKVPDPLTSGR